MCLFHDLGECFTGDIPTFVKTDDNRRTEDTLLDRWVQTLPREIAEEMSALYTEMNAQKSPEAKVYKALDKLEALVQHNESPIRTWAETAGLRRRPAGIRSRNSLVFILGRFSMLQDTNIREKPYL